jgi:hypothetical protein
MNYTPRNCIEDFLIWAATLVEPHSLTAEQYHRMAVLASLFLSDVRSRDK